MICADPKVTRGIHDTVRRRDYRVLLAWPDTKALQCVEKVRVRISCTHTQATAAAAAAATNDELQPLLLPMILMESCPCDLSGLLVLLSHLF